MSVTIKLKAGSTVVWGTEGVSSQGYGKLHSVGVKGSSQKTPLEDENGEKDGVVYFDEEAALTFNIRASSSATNPSIADTITADGVSGYVDDWEKKWEHKGVKMLAITATRLVANSLP